jgi:hypothetical protein
MIKNEGRRFGKARAESKNKNKKESIKKGWIYVVEVEEKLKKKNSFD